MKILAALMLLIAIGFMLSGHGGNGVVLLVTLVVLYAGVRSLRRR
jgi:hypothetical protein